MGIRAWFKPAIGCALIASILVAAPSAMAGTGKTSAAGSTLSVKGESANLAAPGDLPNWRRNYIYIQIATDDASLYRGWDGTPEGVDVTGRSRGVPMRHSRRP